MRKGVRYDKEPKKTRAAVWQRSVPVQPVRGPAGPPAQPVRPLQRCPPGGAEAPVRALRETVQEEVCPACF